MRALEDTDFARWGKPWELAVSLLDPPALKNVTGPLQQGHVYDARALSRPGGARAARLLFEKLGLDIVVSPVKIRAGVRTPQSRGPGMDEWYVSFVWRAPSRTVAPNMKPVSLGPFIIEDLHARST